MKNILKLQNVWRLRRRNFPTYYVSAASPDHCLLLTVNLIGAFKVYTQVYALFGGRAGLPIVPQPQCTIFMTNSTLQDVPELRWPPQ